MASDFIFNTIMASGSVLATLSNFGSYLYVKKTYNLKNTIYCLLATDAIVVSVTSLAMVALYVAMAFTEVTNQVVCGFQLLGYPMLVDVLVIFSFSTSVIRYRRMNRIKPPSQRRDTRELKLALRAIFGYFLWYVLWVILSIVFDLRMFHLYNICLHGTNEDQTTFQNWQALIVCLPVACCSTGTVYLDFQAKKFLQNYSKNDKNREQKVDNVALRGSMVAFAMLLPCMVLCPILGFLLPMGSGMIRYYITFGITIGATVLRNPCVAIFAHSINNSNKRTTAKDTKAAILLKVLDEANERQARIMATRSLNEAENEGENGDV